MKNKFITLFLTFSFFGGVLLISRDFRVQQIPNGSINTCRNCHMSEFGGDARNNFGKLVENRFLTSRNINGDVQWGPLLASLDADNDGATNGQELQDPYGVWTSGSPNPGNSSLVTLPGFDSSSPLTTLTINFSGMTPHVGQTLYLRVIDKLNGKEVGRTSTTISENFSLDLDVVIPGRSYRIDFFADFNSNDIYDTPPTDHAWRLELDNAEGNDELNFAHNTNFTDIDWKYMLTVNFTDMSPHVGQLLELRVEDDLTSEEVGRTRIEFIPGESFAINIPGIMNNREYKIEFYADQNNNGIYDSPPTDHAWELSIESTDGDTETTFNHNVEFTDIGWKYLYTLNLLEMSPHSGQTLELRVYRTDNSEEVGRAKVDKIPGPNFSVSIPQIEIEHDYIVDFYADFNGNGIYDAPPTDHAWRMTFNSSTGNYVQNFTHNTGFTDIEWPGQTSVEDDFIPVSYKLEQNYPNPFNPTTTVRYQLPKAGHVQIKVYDAIGKEVATLVNEHLESGRYEVRFGENNLPSGMYIYTIKVNDYFASKKMLLIK
jgi:hypothetical protein